MRYLDLTEQEFQELVDKLGKQCEEQSDITPLFNLHLALIEELNQKIHRIAAQHHYSFLTNSCNHFYRK